MDCKAYLLDMQAWGERVEERRLKCSERNVVLTQRVSELGSELARAHVEMKRLREEALETCSVSRSVKLQNSHTKMERELDSLRTGMDSLRTERARSKTPAPRETTDVGSGPD